MPTGTNIIEFGIMQGIPVLQLSFKDDYIRLLKDGQEYTDGRNRGFFAGSLFVQIGLNTYPL